MIRDQTATNFSMSKADFHSDFLKLVLVSAFQPQTFSFLALNPIYFIREPFILFFIFLYVFFLESPGPGGISYNFGFLFLSPSSHTSSL